MTLFLFDFRTVDQITSTATAAGTLILAGITGFYVISTYGLLRESREARKQDIAPIVTFDIREHQPVITNIGNGPASHVVLTLSGYPEGPSFEFYLPHLRPDETRLIVGEPYEALFNPSKSPSENLDTIRLHVTCYDGAQEEHAFVWEFGSPTIEKQMKGEAVLLDN